MKINLFLVLIFNLSFVQILFAQTDIKGTVYDANDHSPLPGVNVVLEGTSTGVVTNLEGKYDIRLPTNDGVLVFTFIGMQTQKIAIKGKTTIDVSMVESDNALTEVVLTALGVKREEKALGYAVQEVKGEDAIANGNPNPISGLQGKVAGIQVTQSSGTPGASAKVVIRGNATFGNNQPLIVIDGIPIDNSTNTSYDNNVGGVDQSNRAIDINPDDIESVSVLKGAAATALYGSRAGNGVILYTTKKSSVSDGGTYMSGTFSSDITLTTPINLHKKQEIFGQSAAGLSDSWGDSISGSDRVDAMDNFFKTGIAQNYNLALSGGNAKSSARFSVGYSDSKGIIPNSSWARLSTRLTASSQLTDRLSISGTANLINSGGNRPQKGSNIAGVMLALYRNPINYDPKAAYYDDPVTKGTNTNYFKYYDNPYYSAEKNTYKDDVWRVLGNVNVTYDLLGEKLKDKFTSLSLLYRSGIDSYSDTRKAISPIGSNSTNNNGGIIVDYSATFYEWNNDYILNGGKTLNDRFNLSFILGGNSRAKKDEYILNIGTSLIENDFYNIVNSQTVVSEQNIQLTNEYAAYTDLTFSLDNRLYLGLSGRNEWSSNYNKANNSNFYPAANASFIFSELFNSSEGKSALTFGKFRASIGKTGIAPLPWRYDSYTTAVSVGDGFSDGNVADVGGVLLTNLGQIKGNSDLKPEIQVGKEIGFDLRFWEDRLTLDFGLYQQDISQILIEVPVTAATGFNYYYQNIGKMRNRGIELSIGGDVIRKKDLKWTSNFNFGLNKNKVLDLELTDNDDDRVSLRGGFTSVSSYAAEGEAFGALFGTAWKKDAQGNLLVDADGFYIETEEKVKIGDPNPDFTLGLRNTIAFKQWTCNMFFDGSFGSDIFNGTKAMMNYKGIGIETEDREGSVVLKGVHSDGTVNTTEISKQNYWLYIKGIASAASETIEHDINYVKLRELGVTYQFKLNKKSKLKALTASIIATNVFTITNYSDGDPETSLTGAGSNTSGLDYFNSPNVRGWVFKVGANF